MPEDRKKILEALAAKRKAEAESGEKKKRQKSSLNPAKPVSKPVSKPVGGIGSKGKSTSAPISSTKAKSKHKEEVKAKRVSKMDRYETDEDEESEEEEDLDSESDDDELSDEDSEDDIKSKSVKKLPPQSKGKAPVKGISSSNGKGIMKDRGKAKAKVEESSSDAEGDSDDDGGDLSDDPLQEVDPSNILKNTQTSFTAYELSVYKLRDGYTQQYSQFSSWEKWLAHSKLKTEGTATASIQKDKNHLLNRLKNSCAALDIYSKIASCPSSAHIIFNAFIFSRKHCLVQICLDRFDRYFGIFS